MTTTTTFHGLGADNTLTVYADGANELLNQSISMINAYAHLLSLYGEASLLTLINKQAGKEPVHIPVRPVFNLIAQAIAWSKRGLGYNALIGPIVKLWRIGFDDAHVPTTEEVTAALALTDPDLVELDSENQTVFLTKPGMALDLGGIAKGFIVDQVYDLWDKTGVEGGLIDLGGNQRLVGNAASGVPLWQWPITDPRTPGKRSIATLTTTPKAVVTTGIYERHSEINGKEYHHLIDPNTGYPVESDMASITVVADSGLIGDVLSSIGFYAGIPAGYDAVEAEGEEAIFVTKDTRVYQTSGLRETLAVTM
ncbi:FAD:protein FMN transferase [Lacticaseibacillus paracasei]|uniref:FAD:protein FMN transferase n=1 Tax=Lacticaseibacillus paracasei TaxID=1597 RepID=UPI0034E8F227